MFTTADGGATWEPVKGPRVASNRGAAIIPRDTAALVAGAWGKLGTLTMPRPSKVGTLPGEYREGELDPLAGRTVHGVACSGNTQAFAACDGGAVLTSTDGGKKWGYTNLGLPAAALAACDFRCVAAFGTHVWVAGRPGGFVLHSADLGKTWDVQKTELSVPANGIHFISDKEGWLAGDLGCIIGTVDGGKTWKVQRAGGQRAAALFLHASGKSTPLDVVAHLGAADGYLCASTSLMNADPATADPKKASDGERAQYAMRLAGGAAADSAWAFPLAAHAVGLSPRELLATWDRAHGGKASEQLLRQAVLAIRTWQPEVIVCDLFATDINPADALALNAAKEAFKQAADPNAFPEQIATLGLKPWAAKKLYALSTDPKTAAVKIDQNIFSNRLNDSPKDYAETATRVLAGDGAVTDRRCFVLVAHRLQGSEGHATLMDGVALAPGGAARRAVATTFDATAATEKQKAVQLRRNLETLAGMTDTELGGADKLIGTLNTSLKQMPDDVAARTAFAVGSRLARDGKWIEAREVFGVLTANYPGHPLSVEAFRWLTRYHASTETRRRTEIQQKLMLKNVTFENAGGGKITAAGGTVTGIGGAVVEDDHYKFHSPDMILKWHQACLDLEPKLSAFGPVYSRDPASWLCFLAARRQVGRHADADAFINDYFKHTPGAATAAPGLDPWRDCLAAELWLANPAAIPTPPKALAYCKLTDSRPLLDGKLDDDCWKTAKVAAAESDRGRRREGVRRAVQDGEPVHLRRPLPVHRGEVRTPDRQEGGAGGEAHPRRGPQRSRPRGHPARRGPRLPDVLPVPDRPPRLSGGRLLGRQELEPEVPRGVPRDRHRLDSGDRDPARGADRRQAGAREDVGGERVAVRAGRGRAVVERPGRPRAAPRRHGADAVPRGQVKKRIATKKHKEPQKENQDEE